MPGCVVYERERHRPRVLDGRRDDVAAARVVGSECRRNGDPAGVGLDLDASRTGNSAPAGVDCVEPTPAVIFTGSPADVDTRLSSVEHQMPAAAFVRENETEPYCELAVTV